MPHEVVTIPTTIDEAVKVLDGLGALLTAKEWQKAAIVYAFTEVVDEPSKHRAASSSSMSVSEFAAFGIVGLKSKDTVRRYHKIWAKYGDNDIGPGDKVVLPDIEWSTLTPEPISEGGDGIDRRDNETRVGAMTPAALADHVVARDDAPEVIEAIVEKRTKKVATNLGTTYQATPDPDPDFDSSNAGLWAATTTDLDTVRFKIGEIIGRLAASPADLTTETETMLTTKLDLIDEQTSEVRRLIAINREAQVTL